MEILFLAFILSLSYLWLLSKVFSLSFVIRTQILWDLVFTVGAPCLFLGTFSGMATAAIAGILFSIITGFLSLLNPPEKKSNKRYVI